MASRSRVRRRAYGTGRRIGCLLSAVLLLPGALAAQVDTVSLEELRRAADEDPVYATEALRAFVAEAAEANRRLPDLLQAFHVPVETEVSMLQVGSDGREVVLQVEQVASHVLWRRNTPPVQQVVGYRARTVGVVPSALSLFEVPWVVPTLYGDRIDMVRWNRPARDEEGRILRRRAIHPLGPDRNRVYRFTGGDTVLVLSTPDRRIPLVRVDVEPVHVPGQPTLLFQGHLVLDATRHQIVRMRGRMISSDPDPPADERLLGALFEGATFVEFENAEYEQRFWLPRQQRIEVQAISRFTDTRIVLRLVSRFGFPEVDATGPLAAAYPDPPPGGVLALGDAVRERDFGEWRTELGDLTAEAGARDFRDLEPEARSVAGGPRIVPGVRHPSHLVRANEAEGLFTGLGATVYPGRAWREGRLRLHGGWAWGESAFRGGAEVAHVEGEGRWEWALRGERTVRSTGDFSLAAGRDPSVPPLVAGDGELVYDHRTVGLVARQPRDARRAWRLEAGWGADRRIGEATEDLPSFIEEGSYWTGRVTLERNPGILGMGVLPGRTFRLDVEGATGELEWLRGEVGVGLRRVRGRWSLDGRLEAGATLSEEPPPQRLFELGRYSGLPGYPPRAFAGDRSVLAQGAVGYTLPLLERPVRIGAFYLPGPAPAPAVIVRSGWTGVSDRAAPVLERLGARTTDGVRTTLDLRARFFGGGISLGAARPLDSGGRWRFVWSVGREF